MLLEFIISLLMCVFLVQSQTNDKAYTVSVPIRHSLPDSRTESEFGSSEDGNCSQILRSSEHSDIHRGSVCNGTSVLNDGIIPALSNVSNDNMSFWAAELLTMRQVKDVPIVLSFEVMNQSYDCVELAVFNCPEMNMNASRLSIYQDNSFRPGRDFGETENSFGTNIKNHSLNNASCDYLLKFYVSFMPVNSSYFNIQFPVINSINYVFMGEVSFLTGADDCEQWPPELIEKTIYPQNSNRLTSPPTGSTTLYPPNTSSSAPTPQNSQATLTTVIAAVVVILIVLVAVFFMIVCVCLRNHKRKKVPLKVDNLGCVEDSMTETNKESETKFTNSVHKAASVNNEQLMSVSSIPVLDGVYSNPDEVENNATTSFTERKSPYRAIDQQQTRRNHYSPADNAILSTRHSFTPVTSKGLDDLEGVTYAIPNKEKHKTRQSLASNLSSRAEFEAGTKGLLQEDSDNKVYESVDPVPPSYHNGSNNNLLDPSNCGNDQPVVTTSDVQQLLCSEEAEGILDVDAIYAEPLDPSSTNKPEWDPDQDKYESDTCTKQPIATTLDVQQLSHSEQGILDPDAIYAEPLNPSSTNKPLEWDPDQSIYESVYSESLKPSLFMQETPTECQEEEVIEPEDLYPYSSIYTVPDADLTNKPLLVSAQNIKVLKHLGNGNFGEVVLAQTVDLTPQQLQIESQAPFALVAVKRLKANASEATKELFDKEVKFMSRLNHPNVVRMLAVCTDKENPFILMEYMMNGDLHQYLKRFKLIGEGTYENVKFISISTLTNISLQIASAMQYLASHNFVHRDLATRNCLVGSKNTVKISDFGMSRSLYESHYYIVSGHAILPIRWMATECFYGKFSAKTDVWAFGVTMWEIFTLAKEQPYNRLEDMEVVEDAIKGQDRTLLEQPAKCPQDVYDVMKACWVYDPAQRPTFDELYYMLSKIDL